jgi:hypothetical protein
VKNNGNMIHTTLIPQHKKVMLTVPEEYIGTKLEVIAFPAATDALKERKPNIKSALQAWILQTPTWTDEEYEQYLDARKHFTLERKK